MNKWINKYKYYIGISFFLFILIFPYICGYHWQVFDATINSWEKLAYFSTPIASIISLVSLVFIFITLRINSATLSEMKQQRLDSVKPRLLIKNIPSQLYLRTDKFHILLKKDPINNENPKFILNNVGLESCINVDIKFSFNINKVKTDFGKIASIMHNNIKNDRAKKDIMDSMFRKSLVVTFHQDSYPNSLRYDYIKNEEVEIPIVNSIVNIIVIYSAYEVFKKDIDPILLFPEITIKMSYEDIIGTKYKSENLLKIHHLINKEIMFQYLANKYRGFEEYQSKMVTNIGYDKNNKYIEFGNIYIGN